MQLIKTPILNKSAYIAQTIIFAALFPSSLFVKPSGPPNLEEILNHCAAYCKRLESTILDFVCTEEVIEKEYFRIKEIYGPVLSFSLIPIKSSRSFIYEYQLIHSSIGVEEKRTLKKENNVLHNKAGAVLGTRLFRYKNVVLGPIGILSDKRLNNYSFKLKPENKDEVGDYWVVIATPKESTKNDFLYGSVFVRKTDYAIMRIDWNQRSLGNMDEIEAQARALGATPRISFSSEYDFEFKNIRLPTSYRIIWEMDATDIIRMAELAVTYQNYKFFTVETSIDWISAALEKNAS